MPRPLALAALLLPVLALALALPTRGEAAPKAPPGFFGVDINSGPVDYSEMVAAGVGTTRTIFPFSVIKRERDRYNWSYSDKIVADSATSGINLIPILYGVPPWISDKRNATPLKGRAKTAWDEFLPVLVNRYGPNGTFWAQGGPGEYLPFHPIETWQIWNEPNSMTWWGPRPNPKEYGKVLERSAKTIHALDPNARVMSAGIVAQPTNRHGIPGNEFLDQLLKRRAVAKSIDDIAYHPYSQSVAGVKKQLRGARAVLNRRNSRRTPLWVTEIGWGSKGGKKHPLIKSPTAQRRALRDVFEMALKERRRLNLDGMLWYQWRDGVDDLCLWCQSSGLVDHRGRAKDLLGTFGAIANR